VTDEIAESADYAVRKNVSFARAYFPYSQAGSGYLRSAEKILGGEKAALEFRAR